MPEALQLRLRLRDVPGVPGTFSVASRVLTKSSQDENAPGDPMMLLFLKGVEKSVSQEDADFLLAHYRRPQRTENGGLVEISWFEVVSGQQVVDDDAAALASKLGLSSDDLNRLGRVLDDRNARSDASPPIGEAPDAGVSEETMDTSADAEAEDVAEAVAPEKRGPGRPPKNIGK